MCIERPASGFTLIELIVFIVIVSVGLAGVLAVFNTVTRGSADPIRDKQAFATAESLLEEVLNKNYCDPDTVTPAGVNTPAVCGANALEASRDLYDDVVDYNGYASNGIRDVSNSGTTVLSGYNVSVSVQAPGGAFPVAGATVVPAADYRVVTVTVTDTLTNRQYALTGYAFNND